MAQKAYLAVDMGASSGRARAGTVRRQAVANWKRSTASKTARWRSTATSIGTCSDNGRTSARACGPPAASRGDTIASVGVDTWGVDFGLLGRGDELLGNPYHYRDSRTNGMMEKAFGMVGRDQIFRHTRLAVHAVQHALPTAGHEAGRLAAVGRRRVVPDGPRPVPLADDGREVQRNDRRQHDPVLQSGQGRLGDRAAGQFSLPTRILGKIAPPARRLGPLRANLAAETGLAAAKVVLPGSHDTASAVMAVPAHSHPGQRPDWCYISLGTWALMGIESPQPLVNDAVLKLNFTNEGGVGGTTRLLKNITGLWLVQECRRVWNQAGGNLDWEALNQLRRGPAAACGRSSIPTPPISWPRPTCPRPFAPSAARAARPCPSRRAPCCGAPWRASP